MINSETIEELLGLHTATLQEVARRQDAFEEQLSALMVAYTELFAAVQMLMERTLGAMDSGAQETFLGQLAQFRVDLLKAVGDASGTTVDDDTDDQSPT